MAIIAVMKKGITLKDLARKLNMSVSTVSKALNGDPAISALTAERVKHLAESWHYVPNEAARNFKQNKSFTLGLIIPDLLDQFYVMAINGVEEVAAAEGYNVVLAQSHEDVDREKNIIDLWLRHRIDGIIIAITKDTRGMELFHRLNHHQIPIVFLARTPLDLSFHYVTANNKDGAFKAVEFLFARGHRRIAHLMGPAGMPISHERLEGYRRALEAQGTAYDPALVKEVDFSPASTQGAVDELLHAPNPPTAIFCFKNYVSLDAIDHIKEKYPWKLSQLAIAGFGNLPFLQHLDCKPLASIEENAREMGREAVQLLFSCMTPPTGDNEQFQHIQVPCELVIHE